MHILMLSAENDGIPEAKVGGIGDVVRDVPPALAALPGEDIRVTVVVPSYGYLHTRPGAWAIRSLSMDFAGERRWVTAYEVPGRKPDPKVRHVVLDCPLFASAHPATGRWTIYQDDQPGRPFATDATRFAGFCLAAAEAIRLGLFGAIDCLHLHDWHAAFTLVLRELDPAFAFLRQYRTVFTIHNLGLQGVRPLRGDASSLETWYPQVAPALAGPHPAVEDPDWPDCVNPMAVGIRWSDAVHAVSPSYAEEILLPSRTPDFFGGERLQGVLGEAAGAGRLAGILNGCEYPDRPVRRLAWQELLTRLRGEVLGWIARDRQVSVVHFIALERMADLARRGKAPELAVTGVTRIVEQKSLLLMAKGSSGASGLQSVLETLGEDGILFLLGTGDPAYEAFLLDMAGRYSNFVFLNGFSNACADLLYGNGDVFLMPSSYEPCGISQMLALRAGQPVIAHNVGGLKDTVREERNGFVFEGWFLNEQVDGMVAACRRALAARKEHPSAWRKLAEAARQERFLWSDSVSRYLTRLYRTTATSPTAP
jgi:starch synthase